jgi:hypothetical protein
MYYTAGSPVPREGLMGWLREETLFLPQPLRGHMEDWVDHDLSLRGEGGNALKK